MTIYSNRDTASADIAAISFPDKFSNSITVKNTDGPELVKYLKGTELGYNLFWKNRRTTDKTLKLTIAITLSVQ